jgi:hypothetical protein
MTNPLSILLTLFSLAMLTGAALLNVGRATTSR